MDNENELQNEFHHYHTVRFDIGQTIKKLLPPALFALTLWGIVKKGDHESHANLYYPLYIFTGLTLFNNFV